jgi:hypothetical protein
MARGRKRPIGALPVTVVVLCAAWTVGFQGASFASEGGSPNPAGDALGAATTTASGATQAATSTAGSATQAATSTAGSATQAATSTAGSATQAATSTAGSATQAATETATNATEAVTETATNATQAVTETATNTAQAATNAANNATQAVGNAAVGAGQGVSNTVSNTLNDAKDAGNGVTNAGSASGSAASAAGAGGNAQASDGGRAAGGTWLEDHGGTSQSKGSDNKPDHRKKTAGLVRHNLLAKDEYRTSDMPIIVDSIDEVSASGGLSAVSAQEEGNDPLPGWFLGLLPYSGFALFALVVMSVVLIAPGALLVAVGRSRRELHDISHELIPTR